MKRRKLIQSAVTGAALSGLAGCSGGTGGETTTSGSDGSGGSGGSGGSDGGGTTTGTASSGDWPDYSGKRMLFLTEESSTTAKEIIDRVISDFRDATGADAKAELLAPDELNQRLTQLIQAGDPPELIQQPTSLAVFYGQEQLAPLNTAVDRFEEQWGEPPQDNARVTFGTDDDYFAVLWRATSEYWYRDDVVDTHPETWDDLLTAAENADGVNDLAGTYNAAGQSICVDIEVLGWGYSNGANALTWEDDKVVEALSRGENRQKWIEVLEFFRDLQEFSPSAADAGCGQQINAIADGISATGFYPGARPKIQAIRREREFAKDVRAALQPKKESHVTYGDPEGFLSFQGSNTDVAQTFIEFVYQPEYYLDFLFITPLHNSPPKVVGNSDAYRERLDQELSDAWTQEDIDRTLRRNDFINNPVAETDPPNPVGRTIFRAQPLSRAKFQVVVEGKDPGEAIDSVAPEFQKTLDEAQE